MESKKKEIKELSNLLTEMLLEEIDGPILRTSIETLMTIQVHQLEIIVGLKCKDISDFDW